MQFTKIAAFLACALAAFAAPVPTIPMPVDNAAVVNALNIAHNTMGPALGKFAALGNKATPEEIQNYAGILIGALHNAQATIGGEVAVAAAVEADVVAQVAVLVQETTIFVTRAGGVSAGSVAVGVVGTLDAALTGLITAVAHDDAGVISQISASVLGYVSVLKTFQFTGVIGLLHLQ